MNHHKPRCATEHCVINRCDGLHRLVSSRSQNYAKIHGSALSICSSHIPKNYRNQKPIKLFKQMDANGTNVEKTSLHPISAKKKDRPFSIRLCDMCTASRPRQPPEGCFAMSDRESQWFSKIYIFYMHPKPSLRYVIFPQSYPMTLMTWGFLKKCPKWSNCERCVFNSRLWSQWLNKKGGENLSLNMPVLQVHEAHAYTPVLFKRWVLFLSKPCGLPEKAFRDFDQSKLVFFYKWRSWSSGGLPPASYLPNLTRPSKSGWHSFYPPGN